MVRLTSTVLAIGFAAAILTAGAVAAKDHRHHYTSGTYKFTCVNEEATCGNWNIGKPN
jgi:hypothetical protein